MDSQAVVQMVGFSQELHDKLEKFFGGNDLAVTFVNVQIQNNKTTQSWRYF